MVLLQEIQKFIDLENKMKPEHVGTPRYLREPRPKMFRSEKYREFKMSDVKKDHKIKRS
jgi:hypothetical protein